MSDRDCMALALSLARRGQGHVEPNPMVGCVIARGEQVVGRGWHRAFGGPHAEIEALREAGEHARGATLYVTLEPCCHHGKTPPCTEAVIQAGIRRVVVATGDPFSQVDGAGLRQLQEAGLEVEVGLLEAEAQAVVAPYTKLVTKGRPWVLAKWAMTLDGKIATATGDSRWISSEASRKVVHEIRGRMDAIVVGLHTAERDDPRLTARPAGPRAALRIVLDSRAALSPDSQLVRTAGEVPVLIAAGPECAPRAARRLEEAGCHVLVCTGATHAERLGQLLDELGRRRMTNLLVEGGSRVLGGFFDTGQIDEVHVFLAPKLVGGRQAPSPVAGAGLAQIALARRLDSLQVRQLDGDIYVTGTIQPDHCQG